MVGQSRPATVRDEYVPSTGRAPHTGPSVVSSSRRASIQLTCVTYPSSYPEKRSASVQRRHPFNAPLTGRPAYQKSKLRQSSGPRPVQRQVAERLRSSRASRLLSTQGSATAMARALGALCAVSPTSSRRSFGTVASTSRRSTAKADGRTDRSAALHSLP